MARLGVTQVSTPNGGPSVVLGTLCMRVRHDPNHRDPDNSGLLPSELEDLGWSRTQLLQRSRFEGRNQHCCEVSLLPAPSISAAVTSLVPRSRRIAGYVLTSMHVWGVTDSRTYIAVTPTSFPDVDQKQI